MAFCVRMREVTGPVWDAAVGHRFTRELWSGDLDRDVLTRYLAQDHQFVDAFLALLGAAVAGTDRPAARVRLARQLGLVAGPENDFFERSLAALGVDGPAEPLGPTSAFVELMHDAAGAGHADALAVLVVAEWLYLDWASRPDTPLPGDPIHAEWIELHRGPGFESWVEFLRDELDRAVDGLDRTRAGEVADRFVRAVDLELAFFDAAYG